jgi:hypothetical protein
MRNDLEEKVAAPVEKTEITVVGIRHVEHVAHSMRKVGILTSPTNSGHSTGIIRSRTQATQFSLVHSLH